jgi:hypothetical protein
MHLLALHAPCCSRLHVHPFCRHSGAVLCIMTSQSISCYLGVGEVIRHKTTTLTKSSLGSILTNRSNLWSICFGDKRVGPKLGSSDASKWTNTVSSPTGLSKSGPNSSSGHLSQGDVGVPTGFNIMPQIGGTPLC